MPTASETIAVPNAFAVAAIHPSSLRFVAFVFMPRLSAFPVPVPMGETGLSAGG
jgi:hypothetical protein